MKELAKVWVTILRAYGHLIWATLPTILAWELAAGMLFTAIVWASPEEDAVFFAKTWVFFCIYVNVMFYMTLLVYTCYRNMTDDP